jgi:hypothetical protein
MAARCGGDTGNSTTFEQQRIGSIAAEKRCPAFLCATAKNGIQDSAVELIAAPLIEPVRVIVVY